MTFGLKITPYGKNYLEVSELSYYFLLIVVCSNVRHSKRSYLNNTNSFNAPNDIKQMFYIISINK